MIRARIFSRSEGGEIGAEFFENEVGEGGFVFIAFEIGDGGGGEEICAR